MEISRAALVGEMGSGSFTDLDAYPRSVGSRGNPKMTPRFFGFCVSPSRFRGSPNTSQRRIGWSQSTVLSTTSTNRAGQACNHI